jgi:hypothetical protein
VTLDDVVAAPGWTVDVDRDGTSTVSVHFSTDHYTVAVTIVLTDGHLATSVRAESSTIADSG